MLTCFFSVHLDATIEEAVILHHEFLQLFLLNNNTYLFIYLDVTFSALKALMTTLQGPPSVARCLATATVETLAIQPDSKQNLLTDHGWRGVTPHLNSTFDIRSIWQINSPVTHGQMLWGDSML